MINTYELGLIENRRFSWIQLSDKYFHIINKMRLHYRQHYDDNR
jgi:hypothetical protein